MRRRDFCEKKEPFVMIIPMIDIMLFARKAAMQWTFKPALDQDGKPMVCDTL